MSIPKIENGKLPREPLNANLGFLLPVDSPYGNLTLKLFKIIQRLDHVNLRIEDLNEWFIRRNKRFEAGNFTLCDLEVTDDICLGDEITFWLKRTVDELIGLLYLKEYFINNKKYPDKIEIDSIGDLLHNEMMLADVSTKHRNFLEQLNDISNAHKHSFMGTDMTVTSGSEVCFFALKFHKNDLKNKPKFIWIPAKDIIKNFNVFYKETLDSLKKWDLHSWTK